MGLNSIMAGVKKEDEFDLNDVSVCIFQHYFIHFTHERRAQGPSTDT